MSDENISQLIPIHACEFNINEGLVTALFIKESKSFLDKILFSKINRVPSKIDFDEIGSFVWQQINGQNSVSEISKISQKHFGERIEPVQERVETFIRQLAGTKLINLYKKR
jgi:hypothetical protein